MADDDFQHLMNARTALTKRRLALAQAIAAPGETIPESAIQAIIEVQQAMEVIDIAIEEMELEDELEEAAAEDDE